MKVVISIPDSVAGPADTLAGIMDKSRNELYAEALRAYLETHDATLVRARLDAVYATERSTLDPGWARAQAEILDDEDW